LEEENNLVKKYDELDQYDYTDGEYLEKVIDKYSPLIGMFLISFSELESQLNGIVAEIIQERSHDMGFVILEKITMNNKIDLFYKLFLRFSFMKKPDFKTKLLKIRNELDTLNRFRNGLVHANWASLGKDGYVRTKIVIDSEAGYVKFEKIEVLPKTIRHKIKELNIMMDRLFDFNEKLFNDIQ
jgi:hypothetical protein